MKRLLKWLSLPTLVAMAAFMIAAYSENPYTTGDTAGTAVSGRYGGRYLTVLESSLTHPSHSDGFVDKGDVVYWSDMGLVGVALESASAATEYVTIDTAGIWNLTITNVAAMSAGDEVYMDASAATLSDTQEGGVFYGRVLSAITGTGSGVVRAVLVDNNSVTYIGQNGEVIENPTDGVIAQTYNDDAVELGDRQVYSINTSTSDNDYFREPSIHFEDSASAKIEGAYIDFTITDQTTGTQDVRYDLGLITAGTLADVLYITGGTGGGIDPATDDQIDLGVSNEFRNANFDGTVNIDSLVADTADINAGTVDATIGGITPAAGTFTTLVANTSLAVGGGSTIVRADANQTTISNGAGSCTVALATIAATDVVVPVALESISTGSLWVKIHAGVGFDICLTDVTDGETGSVNAGATQDYTIGYIYIEK